MTEGKTGGREGGKGFVSVLRGWRCKEECCRRDDDAALWSPPPKGRDADGVDEDEDGDKLTPEGAGSGGEGVVVAVPPSAPSFPSVSRGGDWSTSFALWLEQLGEASSV